MAVADNASYRTAGCSSQGPCSEQLERPLDLGAMHVVPCGQLERSAQMPPYLRRGRTRVRGRDLEQDAAWRLELTGAEVVTVDDRGHLVADAQEGLADLELLFPAADREGHVVHRAGTLPCRRCIRCAHEVDQMSAVAS